MTIFPVLMLCSHPGCRRFTHMTYCPDHATEEQRATTDLLDEALLERDLARARFTEAGERVRLLMGALGIYRPDDEEVNP